MSVRVALTLKIRGLIERRDRLQIRLDAINAQIADLVAKRNALTAEDEAQIDALEQASVLKVSDREP